MTPSINLKYATPVLLGILLAIWLVVLQVHRVPLGITVEALKTIPDAAGYATILIGIFSKWLWHLRIFRGWLVTVPNLNGTWKGKITSTWIDKTTGTVKPPIDAYIVIRQSLFQLSCVLMTKEAPSYSKAVSLKTDPQHDHTTLDYIYSSSPKYSVHHRSTAHEGACSLDVISRPKPRLIGRYWTDRETKGGMDFAFLNKDHRQSFDG